MICVSQLLTVCVWYSARCLSVACFYTSYTRLANTNRLKVTTYSLSLSLQHYYTSFLASPDDTITVSSICLFHSLHYKPIFSQISGFLHLLDSIWSTYVEERRPLYTAIASCMIVSLWGEYTLSSSAKQNGSNIISASCQIRLFSLYKCVWRTWTTFNMSDLDELSVFRCNLSAIPSLQLYITKGWRDVKSTIIEYDVGNICYFSH